MKHTLSYSHAHGALLVFSLLFLSICFFDGTWLNALYTSYMQPHTTAINKTHVVIGAPNKQPSVDQTASSTLPTNIYSRVLFSPDDDIAQELITLINQEKKSIRVAIFTFTDNRIAQALIDAAQRKVAVEVIADTSYLRDQYSKIPLLQQHNIPIFTYNPHYKGVHTHKKRSI